MKNAKKSACFTLHVEIKARQGVTRFDFTRNSEADRLVRVNKKVKSPNLSNLKEMMKNFGTFRKEILSAVSRSLWKNQGFRVFVLWRAKRRNLIKIFVSHFKTFYRPARSFSNENIFLGQILYVVVEFLILYK